MEDAKICSLAITSTLLQINLALNKCQKSATYENNASRATAGPSNFVQGLELMESPFCIWKSYSEWN